MLRPEHAEAVAQALAAAASLGTGVIARGAGCSYGDAAQNEGGVVLDMSAFGRILSIDTERRVLRAQAGATIAELMAALAPHDLTLPVVPGTRHVTLAGAIASDIHGKNHHRDGGFARHVTSISLCTPAAGLVEITPESDADLFYATLGGMGLTGVILEATLHVDPLASPWVAGDIDRTAGLEETLELLGGEEHHRYSVAWLDMLAPGAKMGRAVITRADPLPAADAPVQAGRLRRGRALVPSLQR
ncbi:MAG TPA: FAD-binding oxidoreductase, partial [Solirubrobacteraceae bacterium]